MRLMDRSVVLSAKVTSGPVTALIDVKATDIFSRRYLKIINPAVNEYLERNFAVRRYIQNSVHIILLKYVEI